MSQTAIGVKTRLFLVHHVTRRFVTFALKCFFLECHIWILSRTATGVKDTANACASCNSTFRDIGITVFMFLESNLDSVTNCDWR